MDSFPMPNWTRALLRQCGILILIRLGLSAALLAGTGPRPQSLTWNTPDGLPIPPGTTARLSASADSGLPVTFRLVAGPAVLDGSSLTPTNFGTLVLSAEQAGNAEFAPTHVLRLLNRTGVEFEPIGQWPRTPFLTPTAARVRNSLAYLTLESRRLVVLDVASAGDPELVGQVTVSGVPSDLDLAGDLAAVALPSGVELLDVSVPSTPRRVGAFQTRTSVQGVRIRDGRAYLATAPEGLWIYEVSDPQQPRALGNPETGHSANAVRVVGNRAYLACNEGLEIVDVSDATNPVLLSFLPTSGTAQTLELDGTLAYVGTSLGGLQVIDIQDPIHPVQISQLGSGSVRSVFLRDGLALVSVEPAGLQAIDIRDPANLRDLGSLELPGLARSIGVSGSRWLAFGRGIGVQPVDFTDPAHPVAGLEYTGSPNVQQVEAVGGTAYLAQGSTLNLIDIRDPARPVRFGRYRTAEAIQHFAVTGNRIWLATSSKLEWVDLSNPERPELLLRTNWSVGRRIDVQGDLGYLLLDSSLRVLDLHDPVQPVRLGSYASSPGNSFFSMVIRPPRAYLSDFNNLWIVNLGNPALPVREGMLPRVGNGFDLAVDGDLAVVPGTALTLVSVRDPSAPQVLGRHVGSSEYLNVALRGTTAFAVNRNNELLAFDVTEPSAPVAVGRATNVPPSFSRLIALDDRVLTVSESAGLRIHRTRTAFLQSSGFAPAARVGGDQSPLRLPSESSAGLPLTYSVISGPATLTNLSLHLRQRGRVTVRVTQTGTPQFAGFVQDVSFLVEDVPQQLGWTAPAPGTVLAQWNHPIPVAVTNSSGLPVQVEVNGGPAYLGPEGLVATNDGTVFLSAFSLQRWPYRFASIERTLLVSRTPQVLTWNVPGTNTVFSQWNRPIPVEATSDSGLAVRFTIRSGPGRLEGGQLIITNDGPVEVIAEQSGDDTHRPVQELRTFEVRRTPQSITWEQPGAGEIVRLRESRRLVAVASSGLPVQYRLTGGPARLEGDILTVTQVGPVRLVAEQSGNDSFAPVSRGRILNRTRLALPSVGAWTPELRGPTHAVRVVGNRAYVALGGQGLLIHELSTNGATSRIGAYRTGGGMEDLQVRDGLAWIADGPNGLLALDVRDPAHPTPLGRIDVGGPALGVALAGPTACVAAGEGGVVLVDISDPTRLRELGRIDTPGNALKVVVEGSRAFVADFMGGLRIIDFSNPAIPTQMSHSDLAGPAYGVAVQDGIAYVCADSVGLVLLDVRNPLQPVKKGTFATEDQAFNVTVARNLALVSTVHGGLLTVDVTDPSRPVLLGSDRTGGFIRSAAMVGDRIVVADQDYGVRVLSRLTPGLFGPAPMVPLTGDPWGVRVQGGLALVPSGTIGVHVVDVTDPLAMRRLATLDTPGFAVGVDIAGSLACVADGGSGVHLFDLSDPSHPRRTATYETGGFAQSVRIAGGIAYVADEIRGLLVLDIQDPTAPARLAGILPGGGIQSVWVSGERLFLIERRQGLQVWDIGQPAAPSLLGRIMTPDANFTLTVSGDLAFVGLGNKGMWIVDVHDPRQPVVLSGLEIPGIVRQLGVESGVVHLANHSSELVRLDVRNPAAPVFLPSVPLTDSCRGIAVQGGIAFAAVQNVGLVAVDANNPVRPGLLSEIRTSGRTQGLDFDDDNAYLADGTAGVKVIDIRDPSHPSLRAQVPTTGDAWDIRVANGTAFVAEGATGLGVVDVRNPGQPGPERVVPIPGIVESMEVLGQRLFIAAGTRGLIEAQIDGTRVMVQRLEPNPSGYTWNLRIVNGQAFVARDSDGMEIFSLEVPGNPRRRSVFRTRGRAYGVAVSGGVAVIAEGEAGLEVVDVSDLNHPVRLARFEEVGDARDVWFDGDRLWVAAGRQGVRVLDLHEAAVPVLIGSQFFQDSAYRIRTRGSQVFLAEGFAGLRVVNPREGIPQTLTFQPPSLIAADAGPIQLTATSDSGLAVRFERESGPAGLAGDRLEPTGTGQVVVRAVQSGDALFLPEYLERDIRVVESLPRIVPGSHRERLGRMAFRAEGRAGEPLVLLESEDLTHWREIPAGTFPADGVLEVEVDKPGVTRFFRVRAR